MNELVRIHAHLLRTDYMVFVERCFATLNPAVVFRDNWHVHAVAEGLRQIDTGEIRNLIVNLPPRSGKSIVVTTAYSAWRIGHDPRTRIICVSSEDRLVQQLSSWFQTVVDSDWYRRAFPHFQIARPGNRARETITTMRGYRLGVSIGGSVLGRGADLIIADDAMGAGAAFSDAVRQRELDMWTTKFPSRLDDRSKGATIIVGQRLHENDLVGHVTSSGDAE